MPVSGLVSGARAVAASEGNAVSGSPGGTIAATPDAFSGALTSAIPLRLPPGTKSPIASLALSYNSRRGNGPVGIGWSLELPYISIASSRSASASSIQYVFHNGAESIELIRKSGEEYVARIERSFMRFWQKKAVDGVVYWQVATRQGVVLQLGMGPNARLGATTDGLASAWWLETAVDPLGSRLSVIYDKSTPSGFPLPVKLIFDREWQPGAVQRSLNLTYEDRPDQVAVALPGVKVELGKRLSRIDVLIGAAPYDAVTLKYEDRAFSKNGGATSLLKEVRLLTAAPAASPFRLAAFDYGPVPTGVEAAELGSQPFALGAIAEQCLFGNFSGKGRTDMICHHQGDWHYVKVGSTAMATEKLAGAPKQDAGLALREQCLVGEFDGSGQANIACFDRAEANWLVMRLRNESALSAEVWEGPAWTGQCLALDLNRDGRTDLACQSPNQNERGQWNVSLSTGRSWATSTWSGGPVGGLWIEALRFGFVGVRPFAQGYCLPGDFNGDGKSDIACYRNDLRKWQVAISTGAGWDTRLQDGPIPEDQHAVTKQCVALDFDADGRSDIACAKGADTWSLLLMHPAQTRQVSWTSGPPNTFAENCLAADLNGDGKIDFACNAGKNATWTLMLNTGSGWQREDIQWIDLAAREAKNACFSRESGFQKTELVCARTDGVYERIRSAGVFSQLLREVVNAIGARTTIGYESSADTIDPRMPATPVVSRISTGLGTGVDATTVYAYSGGRFHYLDRSFRGFSKVVARTTSHAQVEASATEQVFFQGAPTSAGGDDPDAAVPYLRGRLRSRQVTGADGRPLVRQEFAYRSAVAAPYFSPLHRTLGYACASECVLVQSDDFEVDASGNIVTEVRRFEGSAAPAGRRIERTFQDSADGTLLGVLSTETVLSLDRSKALSETRFFYDNQKDCATGAGSVQPVAGLVTRISRTADDGTEAATEYSYDKAGNVTCVRDALGHLTRLAVDADTGFLKSSTNALGHVTSYSYYGTSLDDLAFFGQVKAVTGPDGIKVTSEYDGLRRLAKVFVNDRKVAARQLEYWDVGDPQRQRLVEIDALGHRQTTRFDGGGHPIRLANVLSGSSNIERSEQWIAGSLLLSRSLPAFANAVGSGATKFHYDALGRVRRIDHPSGRVSLICHVGPIEIGVEDGLAKRAIKRSSSGDIVNYSALPNVPVADCNAAQAAATRQFELGGASEETSRRVLHRDELGRIVRVVDGGKLVRSVVYDRLGRVKEETDTARGTMSYVHDLAGNVILKTDASGRKVKTDYDALHRPTRVRIIALAATAQEFRLSYDDQGPRSVGKLTSIVSGGAVESLAYDDDGRPAGQSYERQGESYRISNVFDTIGRISAITYPDGAKATYSYDGRVLREVSVNGAMYAKFENPTPTGAYRKAIFGNGVVRDLTYSEPANIACPLPGFLLCSDTLTAKDGSSLAKRRLVFDSASRLLQLDTADKVLGRTSSRFFYDKYGRLAAHATKPMDSEWRDKPLPDVALENVPAGSIPPEYKELDPDATWLSIYSYDAAGNISWSARNGRFQYPPPGAPQADAVRQVIGLPFVYDDAGRATRALGGVKIDYDASGRPAVVDSGASKTSFVFGGSGQLTEYQAPGQARRVAVGKLADCMTPRKCRNAIQVGNEVIGYVDQGSTVFTHRDQLGSVGLVTDGVGRPGASFVFEAYGNLVGELGGPLKAYKSYAGGQAIEGIEAYRMGPRLYFPRIGRFVSPDPVANWDSFRQYGNPYAYAFNRPTYWADPEGDFPWAIVAVAALIGGYQASQHGDNILEGALRGAVFGVFIAGGYAVIGAAGVTSSFGQGFIIAYSGAWGGVTQSAIWGGDPGQAAQAGALSALGGHLLGGMEVSIFGNANGLAGTANYVATTAVKGAALSAMYAAATGRDIREAAVEGAQSSATGALGLSALHHGVGLAFSGKAPTWDASRKAFVYRMTQSSWHGISLGNVVSSNQFGPAVGPPTRWNAHVLDHEANHTWKQSTVLGAGYGYAGSHAVAILMSLAFTGNTHEGNILEADFGYIDVPYD